MKINITPQFLRGFLLEKGTFGIRRRKPRQGDKGYTYPYIRVIVARESMMAHTSKFLADLGIHNTKSGNALYVCGKKNMNAFLKQFDYDDYKVWSEKPKYDEVVALLRMPPKRKR